MISAPGSEETNYYRLDIFLFSRISPRTTNSVLTPNSSEVFGAVFSPARSRGPANPRFSFCYLIRPDVSNSLTWGHGVIEHPYDIGHSNLGDRVQCQLGTAPWCVFKTPGPYRAARCLHCRLGCIVIEEDPSVVHDIIFPSCE